MVRKTLAIFGSAIFLVLAPGFVAGMVPWWISHWRVEAPFLGLPLLRFVGGVLLAVGAIGLLDSDVRGGCGHHPWSGCDPRERRAARIRRACLVSVSPLCAGLRRTDAKSGFWIRVHCVLRRCPTLDTASHPTHESSERVVGDPYIGRKRRSRT